MPMSFFLPAASLLVAFAGVQKLERLLMKYK